MFRGADAVGRGHPEADRPAEHVDSRLRAMRPWPQNRWCQVSEQEQSDAPDGDRVSMVTPRIGKPDETASERDGENGGDRLAREGDTQHEPRWKRWLRV